MSHPHIALRNLTKRFGMRDRALTAVRNVNLEVGHGEFVAVIGPSGCGKSTILGMTAGLLTPSDGVVEYDGAAVTGPNTECGYVTQKDSLLPWRTVEQNVATALEIQGMSEAEASPLVAEMISRVGLAGFEKSYPGELSGGMRQRAALARTLIYSPKVILADEPFAALDAQIRLQMRSEFLRLWEKNQGTVLFVTHDIEEAVSVADRLVVFTQRPGRIAASLDIPLPRPRDLYRLRFDAEFVHLAERAWELLEAQMTSSDVEEATG